MSFGEALNSYLEKMNCNTNDICKNSGLSYSLVNRYLNNKRTPKDNSKYFEKLVDSIYQISLQKGIDISKESISETLKNAINANSFNIDYDLFVKNFNTLQNALSITTVEISKAIGYDSSFISRIKNGERKPADFENFIDKLRNYVFSIIIQNNEKKSHLAALFNCSIEDLKVVETFNETFSNWLCSKHIESKPDDVYNFLTKLDNFNLNDYVGTDFSKIKVPTTPVILRNSKMYFGIDGRKQAEGEFLKTTLISKSEEPIFFYSDLPMSSAGMDDDFKKKWVFAMTRLLKKGLHLNMIHNLNRPINELLLGLENWIPIYMTGSITPYYFKNPPSNFFNISHCTSGSVALSSECIKYNERKSKFYLTTKKEEVEFAKEKSKYMLSKAVPLMDIYKEANKKEFDAFMSKKENKDFKKIKKDVFRNIDFYINNDKWVMINKKTSPEIHFVIYHEKLINAFKTFLTT